MQEARPPWLQLLGNLVSACGLIFIYYLLSGYGSSFLIRLASSPRMAFLGHALLAIISLASTFIAALLVGAAVPFILVSRLPLLWASGIALYPAFFMFIAAYDTEYHSTNVVHRLPAAFGFAHILANQAALALGVVLSAVLGCVVSLWLSRHSRRRVSSRVPP